MSFDELLERSSGFMESKVLLAGVELGVFERLAGGPASAGEIAAGIGGTPRGTEILLDALAALGFLGKDGLSYHNLPALEEHLTSRGDGNLLGMLRHRNRLFRIWAFLEERVLGEPLPEAAGITSVLTDPEANENFIRAMFAGGSRVASAVAARVDLREVRRLADLGGGPGHYLAEFAGRAQGIEPYLIDLPLTIAVARKILARNPVYPRVRFVEWDFYHEPAPPGLPPFDLIFVSAVLHAESPENNRALLRALHPMVSSGGRLIVHENTVETDRSKPREGALFAVNMLAATEGGRTYTEEEIASWGEESGFVLDSGERVGPRSYLVTLRRTT